MRRTRLRLAGLARGLLLAAALAAAAPAGGQEPGAASCPARADSLAEAGWTALGAGRVDSAGARFAAGLALCPAHVPSRIGRGYVALREGRLEAADADFAGAVEAGPGRAAAADALAGRGLVAWRRGDLDAVHDLFTRVLSLDPGNAEAARYLARLPRGVGTPPARPALARPDTLEYPARVRDGRFEVRSGGGWSPFYVRGVNLGAALPGRHPSEFPDSATYAGWIREMAEAGVNAVRVYTIHPAWFYRALAAWNGAHPDSALWLIHGVWTELPPGDDFRDPEWEGAFFGEMDRVVDLLHGRADVRPSPGHASGFYTADVSRWVLAYIIGREWEPYAVVAYNRLRAGEGGFEGRYLRTEGGSPADAWMARAMEHIVAYETEKYGAQRPVAYTNWPTLDPLYHPTEATVGEEMAMRALLGEDVDTPVREYDSDATGLDAALMHATPAFAAGDFVSYHAYPYYPDFMVLDPAYNRAESPFGRSSYYGYLAALKAHYGDMAVLISEYGVPASLGSAHLQPQGWHQGALTEARMADADVRLTREIRAAGMAGGVVFSWIDEWFKKNWVTVPFEIPQERNRLWYNRLDAEQHYGLVAYDAAPPVAGATLRERRSAWDGVPALYDTGAGRVRAAADAAYLWLLVEPSSPAERLELGFDIVLPDSGTHRLPGVPGRFDAGLELALTLAGDTARLAVNPGYDPWRIQDVAAGSAHEVRPFPDVEDPPPGVFSARVEQGFGRPIRPLDSDSADFRPMRVVTNRRRITRDTVEYLAAGYERGALRGGAPPDGLWERDADGAVEVRIPWALLNFTDPSQRRALLDETASGDFGTVVVPDIGIVGAYRPAGGEWRRWPAAAPGPETARFSWPTWEEPAAVARPRPALDAMRALFREWSTGSGYPSTPR